MDMDLFMVTLAVSAVAEFLVHTRNACPSSLYTIGLDRIVCLARHRFIAIQVVRCGSG